VDYGGTPASPRSLPPELGQHTDEILAELGRDAATIADLRSRGAVACRFPLTPRWCAEGETVAADAPTRADREPDGRCRRGGGVIRRLVALALAVSVLAAASAAGAAEGHRSRPGSADPPDPPLPPL